MPSEEQIEQIRELAYSGKEYETIQSEIEQLDLTTEESNELLIIADSFIVEYELASQEKSKVLNYIIIGVFFFIFGIAFTFTTFIVGRVTYYIAYGAILIGGWTAWKNYLIYQQPVEYFIPEKSRFKNRRKKHFR